VFLHTDAAQAVGKIPVNVDDWKVDLMSISGHKIYGPKGVGAIYLRRRPRVRCGSRLALRSACSGVHMQCMRDRSSSAAGCVAGYAGEVKKALPGGMHWPEHCQHHRLKHLIPHAAGWRLRCRVVVRSAASAAAPLPPP
jgi:hypothetical protein